MTTADWTNAPADLFQNFFFTYPITNWSLADRQTLECQIDLVSISNDTTNSAEVMVGSYSAIYVLHRSLHAAFLTKWKESYGGGGETIFWCDNTIRPRTGNVVLSLALTRDKGNVIITTRELDKANGNAVLFERSFTDTPGVDPSVSLADFRALTGITTIYTLPDDGVPITSGFAGGIGLFQYTDGHQPPVTAMWDNYSLKMHEVPPVAISRVLCVSWPRSANASYSVEFAPTVLGPWLPVQTMAPPGIQQTMVPVGKTAEFFRLKEAP